MIPRHRPPFGPWALFSQACRSIFQSADVDGLEQRYARQLGVAHAVWIPSARFGITAAIQQATEPKSDVVCPIFNCGAVFHAVSETGRRVRFADCAPNQFLLDTQADQNLRSGHAVVLSEMFGHRFSATMLRQPLIKQASLRVFDLAMGIPEAGDMERLSRDDVAVVSFGLGKSLYAGWGGMLLTHSKHMADAVRLQRRRFQQSLGLTESTKLSAQIFARTIAHEPRFYKWLRRLKSGSHTASTTAQTQFSASSHEWHRPVTGMHLTLAHRNLTRTTETIRYRKQLASEYARRLPQSEILVPPTEDVALSHYSVRVAAEVRDSLRAFLWQRGVDTATLFPFSESQAGGRPFPNAAAASREVINLPLSTQLRLTDITRICDLLTEGLQRSGNDCPTTLRSAKAA